MYRFLAKLGRNRWTQFVTPTFAFLIPTSYLFYHQWGLPKVRALYSVKDGVEEMKTSVKLRGLIDQVIMDTADLVYRPIKMAGEKKNTPIEWFLSVAPMYAGATESNTGSIIGLPVYFEYETPNDIPQNQLELTLLPFFKVKPDEPVEEHEDDSPIKESDKSLYTHEGRPKSIRIDINSEDGQKYVNSMLLSDNAKKFLIARQMFYSDTYQVMLNFFLIAVACLLPITINRAARENFGLIKHHLSRRFPIYVSTFTFGVAQGFLLKDLLQFYYDEKSDQRAGGINNDYLQGGIEYYTKCIQRNLALRNMHQVFTETIDKKGNLKHGLILRRKKELLLTERLERLLELQKEKQKA